MTSPLLPDPPFDFTRGTAPLLVSMPHVGTQLPPCMKGRLSAACEPLGDTDWHLPRLYDFVASLGASTLVARFTRFCVDLNRPPDDAPLYATATTGLHPDILFDGTPAFLEGRGLTRDERGAFLAEAWIPYHAKLGAELERIRGEHGYALLFDAHSIASVIPRLFDGRLPDFNIGTADGHSAGPAIFSTADQFFKFMVYNDPTWDYRNFNFDSDLARTAEAEKGLLNATNPNLSGFMDRGGKLIQYHGWSDPQIAPSSSVEYYKNVLETSGGAAKVQKSYRLFMVPGMAHCRGGDGTSSFDMLSALQQWVENGKAPDRIDASRVRNGITDRTRPLCPYPQLAVYTGTGSTDQASNFSCKLP